MNTGCGIAQKKSNEEFLTEFINNIIMYSMSVLNYIATVVDNTLQEGEKLICMHRSNLICMSILK